MTYCVKNHVKILWSMGYYCDLIQYSCLEIRRSTMINGTGVQEALSDTLEGASTRRE